MSKIFLHLINMSISASYIVLAVLILRPLLKKAPKWIAPIFWGIVAVRLLCPFSFESIFSLIPSAQTVSPDIMMNASPSINSGIPIVNDIVNPIISGSFSPSLGDSANPLQIWIPVITSVWLGGVLAMLAYAVFSYVKILRKVRTAVLFENNIYQSENVASPFVLGIIKPKIYLPFNIDKKDTEYVIAHERSHIKRKDHLWKPLGFILLAIYWFNPLFWLAYVLLCRDIELACDEKVIKELDGTARADYSEALLNCSVNRRMISACPLAFGEVGIKKRIRSVLSYKKPAFWLLVAALVACTVVTVCFLTNPIDEDRIGINSISVEKSASGTVNLKIGYHSTSGGYSIDYVGASEGEYCGDGMREYDGALGQYRILIKFGDTEPSNEFAKKYPAGEAVELKNAPIKTRVKRVHPEDNGFYLYVGFDLPITVGQVENGKLSTFGGSITVPIKEAILPAWVGEYSEEKLLAAIDEYEKNYTPFINSDASYEDHISFDTGFEIATCEVSRIAGVSKSDPEFELTYFFDWHDITHHNGSQVVISTIYPLFAVHEYPPLWSYLVCATDTEGNEHYYYFRVIYPKAPLLMYASPYLSYIMDPSLVPSLEINGDVLYKKDGSDKQRIGTVSKVELNDSNFTDYFDLSPDKEEEKLIKYLLENNSVTYDIALDTPEIGAGLYYIMEQKDGTVLIVYGHYENGIRENFIRWIYKADSSVNERSSVN